ncbi:hypothetical protein CMO96_00865, partial [Candidatus Woesebacteria bacterium]|nr:hypothetical protein [Candidatus Woesebacteria bacterium]
MDSAAQRAIEKALHGDWKEAVVLNEQILKDNPGNKEALNRLARAYLELGKLRKATTYYKKVLTIDPYNGIAKKSLDRLGAMKSKLNGDQPQETPSKQGLNS